MRRGRGRGVGKRSIESAAPDPEDIRQVDEVNSEPMGRGMRPQRKIAKLSQAVQQLSAQELQPPPPSSLVDPAPVEPLPQPDPIDARLLSLYGGFNQEDLNALELFFGLSSRFCEDDVIQGLLKLSVRMRVALERHRMICNDLSVMNGRVDALHNSNMAAENLIEEIRVENAQLKVGYSFLVWYTFY
jgi:hypothetical protein